MSLASREQAHAWELRTAWALGREIVLVLDPEFTELPRVRGTVAGVAVTGAFVLVNDGLSGGPIHVPCLAILAIRRPHFTEDPPIECPAADAPDDGQLSLFAPACYN